jgi:cell shape-determining protein MreC
MKMMYQIKHSKRSFLQGDFFKIFIVSLSILSCLLVFGFFGPAKSFIYNTFSPLFALGDYFYRSISFIPKSFFDRDTLIKENELLSEKLEESKLETTNYETIKRENQKLRENLNLKPEGYSITASVVAKPPQIPLGSLFLDRGRKDGVAVGDLVLAGDRILIGKIAKVTENKATASLNSSVGAITYGFVDRTDEPIEIKGVGGGNMEAKMPIDFDIEIGDQIMVNDSSIFISAIVGAIEKDESLGFKKIFSSLPISVSKIRIVFVKPQNTQ